MDLEEDLRDQLSGWSGSQRCLIGDEELLLIVHEVPEPGAPERQPLVFWKRLGHGWVGPDLQPGLRRLIALLGRYESVIDDNEEDLDEPESAEQVFRVARHAGPLSRSMRNLVLAIDQACTHDPDNRTLRSCRDRGREIERAAELLFQDAKLTLDFTHAEGAEEQQEAAERLNVIAFRLNLMAGFFLPMMAIGGLLGMNVELPHFLEPSFWAVLVSGLLIGGLLVGFVGARNFGKRR